MQRVNIKVIIKVEEGDTEGQRKKGDIRILVKNYGMNWLISELNFPGRNL